MVYGVGWQDGVLLHNIVVHQRGASEQRETTRTTQYTAKHVLRSFLQPVSNSILELLEPHDWPCSNNTETLNIRSLATVDIIIYVFLFITQVTDVEASPSLR